MCPSRKDGPTYGYWLGEKQRERGNVHHARAVLQDSSGMRGPGLLPRRVRHARIEAARRLRIAHGLLVADLRREEAEHGELLHLAEVVGRCVGRDGRGSADVSA